MRATRSGNVGYYLAQLLLIAVFAFPLVWVLSLSLKSAEETLQSPPSLLPQQWLFSNYTDVLDTTPIGRYLLNSIVLVALSVARHAAAGGSGGVRAIAFRLPQPPALHPWTACRAADLAVDHRRTCVPALRGTAT